MSKNGYWYGYLEAGSKSSAVLLDPACDTGSKKTVYMFNLARNQILEYTREIVEPRLRDLKGSEQELVPALESGYVAAKRAFGGGRKSAQAIPETGSAPRRAAVTESDDDADDFVDMEVDVDDESMDDEELEEDV